MKRLISVLCAAVLVVLSVASAGAADKAYQKGDADMNDRIAIGDATLVQRYLAELADCNGFWQFFTADADNDGKLSVNDVTTIQRELAQFETSLKNIPYGNATIAQAAATMAYEHPGDGYYAPGTQIYRDVFYKTMGDDEYKRSCDRFVCAAVRWSGADDDYPLGHVGNQADHIYAHPEKWQDVFGGSFMVSDNYRFSVPAGLQPGDVVIEYRDQDWRSHTFIYCGEGLIASFFPNSADQGYDIASASYDDYAPECRYWHLSYNLFRVFRCVKYETNSKYKSYNPL